MQSQNSIFVVSHRIPYPPNKGEKIRTFYQIKELVRNGYEVTVFCPFESGQDESYAEELESVLPVKVVGKKLPHRAARLIKGLFSGQSLSASNFYSKKLASEIKEYAGSSEPKAVLFTASSLMPYGEIFQDLATLRIMDFMDVDSDKWHQYSQKSGFLMSLLYKREHKKIKELEKRAASTFDACFLIAQPEVDLFTDTVTTEGNVKVLGNGMDTESFYPNREKQVSPPVLLFTGVMDYEPNADAVVWFVENCWQAIRQEFTGVRFVIAGMNPSEQVKKLADYDGVEVTGFVDDILEYFHHASMFIAPFRLARGVQNKVLQAFACSLPVISTPMGAEGIDCENGKHLLIADSPEEFIQGIKKILLDKPFAEQVGDEALALIQKQYSWEGQLSPLATLLRKSL